MRCLAVSPETVFGLATLAVMPFYAAMVAAPRRAVTARLVSSQAFFLVAAVVYALLLVAWAPLPQLWHAFSAAAATGGLPALAPFAALFARPQATALAWVHLLVLDLFQARCAPPCTRAAG